jgi:hypothetical protein
MTALRLDQRLGLVFVPARSFQHLLTIELQRKPFGISETGQPSSPWAVRFAPRFPIDIIQGTAEPANSRITAACIINLEKARV